MVQEGCRNITSPRLKVGFKSESKDFKVNFGGSFPGDCFNELGEQEVHRIDPLGKGWQATKFRGNSGFCRLDQDNLS